MAVKYDIEHAKKELEAQGVKVINLEKSEVFRGVLELETVITDDIEERISKSGYPIRFVMRNRAIVMLNTHESVLFRYAENDTTVAIYTYRRVEYRVKVDDIRRAAYIFDMPDAVIGNIRHWAQMMINPD